MSVSVAIVFPVLLLGALWHFGLDAIWFNWVGTSLLATFLAALLLVRILREIEKREREQKKDE